jgi:hypothetical protein
VSVSIKMTATQKTKLANLGGPEWVRKMIDRAKAPKAQQTGRTSGADHPGRAK